MSLPGTLPEHHGSAPEAFGRYSWDEEVGPQVYAEYHWNEENRLILSESDDIQVRYTYDHAGLRTAKQSSQFGETLYPDRLYQEHFSTTPPTVVTKHIFLGQTRIVSKVHHREQNPSNRAEYMRQNSFTYHEDHLGSTNWVSDYQGDGYEHFQYTPYGESWVAEQLTSQLNEISHRFTGQELDQETGLYAFPARYYDPQTSRWLGADPAMGEYLPVAGQDPDELPGAGGVYDFGNLAVYHYSSNNPLRYVDPTGRNDIDTSVEPRYFQQQEWADGPFEEGFWEAACAATCILNEVSERYTLETGEQLPDEMGALMMQEAIDKRSIRASDAYVHSWDGAATAMWALTELEGSWTYSESPAFLSQHSIFFVYTRSQEESGLTGYNDSGGHFVNSAGFGYFDTWGGSSGSRPFTPAQTDMIEWASGATYGPSHQRKLSNVRGMRNLWFQ